MKTIGFDMAADKNAADPQQEAAGTAAEKAPAPVRSLVQVAFDSGQSPLTYYNDRFDLKKGDVVYVEGKMEGRRGHVVSLTKTFKIRLSDYKRVIGVADRSVKGRLYFGGSHLISFDRNALPYEKVLTWMKAPEPEGTEYVSSSDDETFPLNDLGQMKVSDAVGERGVEYYSQNRVCFLELDGCRGRTGEGKYGGGNLTEKWYTFFVKKDIIEKSAYSGRKGGLQNGKERTGFYGFFNTYAGRSLEKIAFPCLPCIEGNRNSG